MPRRIHISHLRIGEQPLDNAQAHHARDVLRLPSGTTIEAFDDAGATAVGLLVHHPTGESVVLIERIHPAADAAHFLWTVAAAVPKGDRADWMVEKLSELGAWAFIPLATVRSVVLPEGKNKRDRWTRIATEAAKQSRRVGVMRIEELTPLQTAISNLASRKESGAFENGDARAVDNGKPAACFLATEVPLARSIVDVLADLRLCPAMTVFVGPEGGWTEAELAGFLSAGISPVTLGNSILRIETAAVAAGAHLAAHSARSGKGE